jgi:glycerol-3-phosphate dehydrogenase (NAD(P)+)
MRIAVVGAGSWGTALAIQAARAGHPVKLWGRPGPTFDGLHAQRENVRYLPGVRLPATVDPVGDLSAAARDAEAAIVVVPSESCRSVYAALHTVLPASALIVSATKGMEIESRLRMSEVAEIEAAGRHVAVLSGPSFAREVADAQPTAVVVACRDASAAETLQDALSTQAFRIYTSDDVIGVELAGALKNVIAIAAGLVDGLGYGHNTVAALITRGLSEITRFVVASGGQSDTLAGLAGLGDLVLTCTGSLSRNRALGQALGRGRTLEEALGAVGGVAEGVRTTNAAAEMAVRAGVEMPIVFEMHDVLQHGRSPEEAVVALMLRSLKRE